MFPKERSVLRFDRVHGSGDPRSGQHQTASWLPRSPHGTATEPGSGTAENLNRPAASCPVPRVVAVAGDVGRGTFDVNARAYRLFSGGFPRPRGRRVADRAGP